MGVAAATVLHAGAIVAQDAAGHAVPASTATTLKAVGRAEQAVDNSLGAAGDKTVRVRRGVFRYANSAGADEITAAEVGDTCYLVDDQTVAKTSGTNTRSAAGKVRGIEARGVWVLFS